MRTETTEMSPKQFQNLKKGDWFEYGSRNSWAHFLGKVEKNNEWVIEFEIKKIFENNHAESDHRIKMGNKVTFTFDDEFKNYTKKEYPETITSKNGTKIHFEVKENGKKI